MEESIFKCPNCFNNKLVRVMDKMLHQTDFKTFCYAKEVKGITETSFKCQTCSYVLKDKENNVITTEEGLRNWLKEHGFLE